MDAESENPSIHALLAQARALAGERRHEEVLAILAISLAVRADVQEAHCLRADALYFLGRWNEAEQALGVLLEREAGRVDAMYKRANSLLQLGRSAEALRWIEHLLLSRPGNVDVLNLCGDALLAQGKLAEAFERFRTAAELNTNHFNSIHNCGVVLQRMRRYDEALEYHRRAVAIQPDNSEGHKNLGVVLCALNKNQRALESYERAIALAPGDAEAWLYRSLVELRLGEFEQGWSHYAWRWRIPAIAAKAYAAAPEWNGSDPLAGRKLLLIGEQGIGDCIQFVRYLPQVAALNPDITLQVPPKLVSLLARSFPGVRVLSDKDRLQGFDLQLYLASLPGCFHTRVDNIPAAVPYLYPDPARVDAWRRALSSYPAPRVGLAWSGNPLHGKDADRSIPLPAILELLETGAQFISLSSSISDGERALLSGRANVRHWGDAVGDFAEIAALIEALDLVVSVDTSFAHLAGALGKPVWILLSHAPDWRWMLERADSPWYPSARLFRQPRLNDWGPVISAAATALRAGDCRTG